MNNNPDLVCVISDLSGGGTQRVLYQLIKYWVSKGKRISVITFSNQNLDQFQLPQDVDRHVLKAISKSQNSVSGLILNIKRIRMLRKKIKQLRAPVVLSFLTSTNIITIFSTLGMNIKTIISERNDPAQQSFGKIWDWLRVKTYRLADIVTANSLGALQTLELFVPKGKCKLVNNPIFENQSDPAVLDVPTILAVGRLHHQKAYDVLLNAFYLFSKKHPEWQLLILGEGALEILLKKQARNLKIESKVKWMGYKDPFPYYKAADIFVMPSRYEGMPNALLEAMSCEMPVIISDALSGPLEIIRDHQNGLVVSVENADDLSNALDKVSSDSDFRSRLAYNAKKSVEAYSVKNVMPQWDFVFRQ